MTTLYGWVKMYGRVKVMKKSTLNSKSPKKEFTAEEKLQSIINKSTMAENEFGEYLRSNGLHSADIENFRNEYFLFSREKVRAKQDPELILLRKEKKDLQSNLYRKDKALAEMSARIVLLKKSHLLWGDPEAEE